MKNINNLNKIKDLCKNPHVVHSDGMSEVEISLALGIDYKTTKNTLSKACAKLEKIFKERGMREDLEEFFCVDYKGEV